MRRRLRSANQDRTKGLITHYFRIRKALVRPIASCPDPPASTVYSSSGSNSVTLEMPRKSSGETFVWNHVKEKRLLEKLDDYASSYSGYDLATDRVDCSDEAWQSFINIHSECKHLRYEGLRNKELYYNVFDKTHAAGASGYGSVTM
ncbi:hypothetical protein TIFTF001_015353 [Ficus carica]|uniref:Uncharacterized protein n=1 Tax=Ficus carica TaxID=3494 RepID=A0AA88D8W1_FICCA|nr:hypothetical protein TIFTF001_015353 [Ficus carica]